MIIDRHNKAVKKLLKKYRGLREGDLNRVNPEYSCVICRRQGCKCAGDKGICCPSCEQITQ